PGVAAIHTHILLGAWHIARGHHAAVAGESGIGIIWWRAALIRLLAAHRHKDVASVERADRDGRRINFTQISLRQRLRPIRLAAIAGALQRAIGDLVD